MTMQMTPYDAARFGVQLGFPTEEVIAGLQTVYGMSEQEARDLYAVVRERYLTPAEDV
jgi:hypothetical protein